jgi:hypothetical protein
MRNAESSQDDVLYEMNIDVLDEYFRNCDEDCLRQEKRAARGEVVAGTWGNGFLGDPFFVVSAIRILQSEIGREG